MNARHRWRLDHHVHATAGPIATRRIAYDPANRIAGSDGHEFLPDLQSTGRLALTFLAKGELDKDIVRPFGVLSEF